jgi:hypothetical protein
MFENRWTKIMTDLRFLAYGFKTLFGNEIINLEATADFLGETERRSSPLALS